MALVTGYVGFDLYLQGNRLFGHGPLDLLYDDLQLFVLGPFPLQQGGTGPLPAALQIARFAAPLVTIYAFVEAGRLFLAGELQRWRTLRARRHVVVCGSGAAAVALTRRFNDLGARVVSIRARPAVDGPTRRFLVDGDARLPETLRAAGVERASALYACTDDTVTNTVIALAARRMTQRGGTQLAVYALATDPGLHLALQARHLGHPRPAGGRFEFFNIDELAARKLFDDPPCNAGLPHILVIGATAFGRAVVVEQARRWRAGRPGTDLPPTVTLVDENAAEALADIARRYPFVAKVCRLLPHEEGLAALFDRPGEDLVPTMVLVCLDDEEASLRTALTVDRLWHGGPGSLVVRLDRLSSLRDAFDGSAGDLLLDQMAGVLRLFGVVEAACDPALIREDVTERLARVVHDRYRAACLRRGVAVQDNPSMVDWERLPATQRDSCRAQAEDMGRKLRATGCTLAPRGGPGDDHRLPEHTVEVLAEMEHQRWLAERAQAGWRFAERRADDRREHPDLVAWDRLSSVAKNKNRDAMRELMNIIGDAGFRIVRL
ncbi:MAG TPA: RyR domain-containing protein [Pseudonocardiaceae bacterium]|nr:RyR domain-containing protein [Pseudonocardiaceae bacterium]